MPQQETTSAIAVPTTTPALPATQETAYGLGGAALVAAGFLMWLRRRWSRDGLETVKDRAEGSLVQTLLEVNAQLVAENQRLMQVANEAWSVRNSDAVRIAQLEMQVHELRRDIKRLTNAAEDSGMMPLEHAKS